MLLSLPVRAGAGQIGKTEINCGGETVDVHRIGDRLRDIERLVMREVPRARRRVKIVVAAEHHALIQRGCDDGNGVTGLKQQTGARAIEIFGVDVVHDGFNRGGEDVAACYSRILRERVQDDAIDPAAAV